MRTAEHIVIFHVRTCTIFWNIPLLAKIRQQQALHEDLHMVRSMCHLILCSYCKL